MIEPQPPPRILVLEDEPRWLPELQRQFLGERVTVESIAPDELTAPEDRIVVAAAGTLLRQGARAFFAVQADSVGTPLIAVTTRRDEEWEWLLRELGALHVIDEEVGGAGLARACRRCLQARE